MVVVKAMKTTLNQLMNASNNAAEIRHQTYQLSRKTSVYWLWTLDHAEDLYPDGIMTVLTGGAFNSHTAAAKEITTDL
jgi:hypothetical protein